MFGFHLVTIVLIVVWIFIFVIWKFLRQSNPSVRFGSITLLGMFLTFSAFFFEPWIVFDFASYLDPTPALLRVLIPGDLVVFLIQRFGIEWMGTLVKWFERLTRLNGVGIHLIPTLGMGTWFITWMPLIPLFISPIVFVLGLFAPSTKFARIGGWILLCFSSFTALTLLLLLPHLDTVGAESNFQLSLLATLLGAHLGIGPWICITGLLLLGVGGLIEIINQTGASQAEDFLEGNELW